MSSKRPGTVDYSHFDNIDCSSSEDEEDEEDRAMEERRREHAHWKMSQQGSDFHGDEEEDGSYEDDEEHFYSDDDDEKEEEDEEPVVEKVSATENLSMLQKAWGAPAVSSSNNNTESNSETVDASESGSAPKKIKFCVACNTEDPHFKCSRCQVVWYCGKKCQRVYHPIHRQECINASKHFAYWGMFNNSDSNGEKSKKQAKEEKMMELKSILESRMTTRRRRALKRAAAQAAIERAKRARDAAGHAKGGGKGKQETKEETCSICQCEFTFESLEAAGSLCCPGSHYMCAECTGVYVNSVVSDLETSYPPKCSLCRALFDKQHFERQLTASQQLTVQVYAAKQKLKPGQELIQCETCSYLDIVTTVKTGDKEPPHLWWCKECNKGKCLVCLKELPRLGENSYLLDFHNKCGELRHTKALIESALESGSKQSCPACGLAGLKDDACTHMTCPKCATDWCYVCGLDVMHCDKAAPRNEDGEENDIFLHNQDWEVNEKRCPMYLTQILEVDLGWMGEEWEANATDEDFEDDARCLEYFHRFQTIKKLQEVRHLVGPKEFGLAFETFDSIKNSGYKLDEIIETDTTVLIDREEYRRFRAEHPEEEEDGDDMADMQVFVDDSSDDSDNEEEQLQEAIELSRATEAEDQQIREAIDMSIAEMQRNTNA